MDLIHNYTSIPRPNGCRSSNQAIVHSILSSDSSVERGGVAAGGGEVSPPAPAEVLGELNSTLVDSFEPEPGTREGMGMAMAVMKFSV